MQRKIDDMIIYPVRGNPPEPPDGYEAAPGNPFVHLKKLPDCVNRESKTIVKPCCGEVEIMYCENFNRQVTRKECVQCKEFVNQQMELFFR